MKCESPNCKDDAYCIIAMMGHDKHNVYHGDLNIVCGFHERLYRQVAEYSQIYYESRLLEPSLSIRPPAIKFQEVMAKQHFNPFTTFWQSTMQVQKEYAEAKNNDVTV